MDPNIYVGHVVNWAKAHYAEDGLKLVAIPGKATKPLTHNHS